MRTIVKKLIFFTRIFSTHNLCILTLHIDESYTHLDKTNLKKRNKICIKINSIMIGRINTGEKKRLTHPKNQKTKITATNHHTKRRIYEAKGEK